jgi:hypothetical protein
MNNSKKLTYKEIPETEFYDPKIDLPDEKWAELGFADKLYELSNYGRLKSFAYKKNGVILKNRFTDKYLTVDLRTFGKTKNYYIHKLVAEYFVPNDDHNKTKVVHLDNDPVNNSYGNLKWVDEKEAFLHTEKFNKNMKKVFRGKKPFLRKVSQADVNKMRKMIEKGITQRAIAKEFGLSEMQITRIKRNENWVSKKLPKYVPSTNSDEIENDD